MKTNVIQFLKTTRLKARLFFHRRKIKRVISESPVATGIKSEKLTAVLPAYNPLRAHNVPLMVSSLLRCDFVEKVIVTVNNPTCRFRYSFGDARVQVIRQEKHCAGAYRYRVLKGVRGKYFCTIDDDLFLLPHQIEKLFKELISNPAVPHGYCGEVFPSDLSKTDTDRLVIDNEEGEVEILNRVYFFSKSHLDEALRKIEENEKLPNGYQEKFLDDFFISFSGLGLPRVHSIGPIINCFTAFERGYATYRANDFFKERINFLKAKRHAKVQTG